jgi:Na+-translocating ferredoxin:NAD+ oxidoreductase RnfD subunit
MKKAAHSDTALWKTSDRLHALRRFAVAITVLNLLGHTWFGFEQSWSQPLVALATAYALEIFLDRVQSWAQGTAVQFEGGWRDRVDFLLPAHITGLAVAMLLYANERHGPIVFAAASAIASKAVFRVRVGGGTRHFLNPSNAGIALTLLLFPSVGIAQPYQFTENLEGLGDWLLPGLIVLSGTFLNTRFTGRMPVILGWVGGFVLQAWVRHLAFGATLSAALLPLTGMAFLLFTFYMISDPGTTPGDPRAQVAFGAAVAAAYAALVSAHVVFGQFFGLLTVCFLRGLGLWCINAARAVHVRRPADARPLRAPVPLRPLEVAQR